MSERGSKLGRGMRCLLIGCGPMNVVGVACLAPPLSAGRRAVGLPEPHPFYLWVLAAWILAFGVAYFHQGWSGHANRAVLALGAWGKGVFAVLLVGLSATGELPPLAAAGAVPDLALAVVFAGWLWRSHRGERA